MRRLYLFAIGLVGVAIVVWRLVIPPVQDGKDPANQQRVVTRTGPEGRIVTIDTDTVPECAACVVTTPARARLGRLEDPVLLRNIPIIESDSRGNFFAAVAGARDHDIIMYDPDGNVVRTVGRFGSGPGEFRIVWDLYIDRHDTLYVGHDSRLSVFDSAGAFVRGVRLVPSQPGTGKKIVAVDGSDIILSEMRYVSSRDSVVSPLHRYDSGGVLIAGYGPPSFLAALHRSERGNWTKSRVWGQRIAHLAEDGTTWLASSEAGYRLEATDRFGNVLRVIGITAPKSWRFPLFLSPEEWLASVNRPMEVPPTMIRSVQQIDARHIVVVLHVAAEQWRSVQPVVDSARSDPDHIVYRPGYRQDMVDTVIDILDSATGTLLARTKVKGGLSLSRSGVLYRPRVSDIGVIQVDVFDISRQHPSAVA
jgi:hypothetical protein